MSLFSSVSIKVKILSLAAVAIVGFVISLVINFNMNQANTERLQQIQQVFFPGGGRIQSESGATGPH